MPTSASRCKCTPRTSIHLGYTALVVSYGADFLLLAATLFEADVRSRPSLYVDNARDARVGRSQLNEYSCFGQPRSNAT